MPRTKVKTGLMIALVASVVVHAALMLVAGWRLVGFKLNVGGSHPAKRRADACGGGTQAARAAESAGTGGTQPR